MPALVILLVLSVLANFEAAEAKQTFRVKPEDTEIGQGGTVVIPCEVSNRRGRVQWTKDGLTLGKHLKLSSYLQPSLGKTGPISISLYSQGWATQKELFSLLICCGKTAFENVFLPKQNSIISEFPSPFVTLTGPTRCRSPFTFLAVRDWSFPLREISNTRSPLFKKVTPYFQTTKSLTWKHFWGIDNKCMCCSIYVKSRQVK